MAIPNDSVIPWFERQRLADERRRMMSDQPAEQSDRPPHGNQLLPEVAEKYECITIKPRKYNFKEYGEIDLRRITLQEADDLHRRGFPFLKIKNQ